MKVDWNGYKINELIIDGNEKIGRGVYHFSTLAGTGEYTHSKLGFTVKATCPCDCVGGYCMRGNYNFRTTKDALAIRTLVARTDLEFFKNEVIREIKKHKVKMFRIHATGEFFSREYVKAWIDIVKACSETVFWTYTKAYGRGFDEELAALQSLENLNIVDSVIKDCGLNFGHCGYIIDTFRELKARGEDPYICPCGIDKNQHCNDCGHCSKHKYVLFIEHSTGYKAESDPDFIRITELIKNQ